MLEIQSLIDEQVHQLGEKWFATLNNPALSVRVVEIIADHLRESMVQAYRAGLKQRRRIAHEDIFFTYT
jgi:hypothetical protein